VTKYFTEISGITEDNLKGLDPETHSFAVIKEEVKSILDGKIIVGHQLDSDFKVLQYYPPDQSKIWDTAKIDKYMKNIYYINREGKEHTRGARSLKNITKTFVGNNIQQEGKPHSPVEDAISSMNLYRVSLNYPKLPLPSY
jgi:DNA polymerase III alpha subunit (gram-positive type)